MKKLISLVFVLTFLFSIIPYRVEARIKPTNWTTKCTGDGNNKCRSSFTGTSCYSFGEGSRCKSHSSTIT